MRSTSANIGDAAALWVARMDAASWSDADEAELQSWLGGDARKIGALIQAQAAWASLDAETSAQPSRAQSEAIASGRRRLLMGGGAALAASTVGGLIWAGSRNSYSTEKGEIRRLPLEDGSVATINTASEIDVRLAVSRREVRIQRGEAWFKVAKDIRRPFVVEAGPLFVQAVGTAFSVRKHDAVTEVMVTEGVVEAWTADSSDARVRLGAGERAVLSKASDLMVDAAGASVIDQALIWRDGKIDLGGKSLSQAIDEFNRYNRRRIVLCDAALAAKQFDGVFNTDDPEGFSSAVQLSLNVPVDLSGPDRILIGSACR